MKDLQTDDEKCKKMINFVVKSLNYDAINRY